MLHFFRWETTNVTGSKFRKRHVRYVRVSRYQAQSCFNACFPSRCWYLSCLPMWKCTRSATILSMLMPWKYSLCSRWLVRVTRSTSHNESCWSFLVWFNGWRYRKRKNVNCVELNFALLRSIIPRCHPVVYHWRILSMVSCVPFSKHSDTGYIIWLLLFVGSVSFLLLLVVFIGVCSQDQFRRFWHYPMILFQPIIY